jgi:tetratricopeptide (TPR) repeat protein
MPRHHPLSIAIAVVWIATGAGCSSMHAGSGATADVESATHIVPAGDGRASEPIAGTAEEQRPAPLFDDLGDLHHPITTDSTLAQRYFDQGLTLCYAFNHAEAVRSFQAAIASDARCAMCYWGVALALGPNINAPMPAENAAPAWEALQKARDLAPGATARERAYIDALASRYRAEPAADRSSLDAAYAIAMRALARAYPDDLDAVTLSAEAVMDTMPWDYYLAGGAPKPAMADAIAALESVLARNANHIGALHFYIHAMEPSATPEKAEAAADRLGQLVPGAGHLVHMPAHIYYRVGRYDDAVIANQHAAAADESYITQCRAQGFYPAMYYPHNLHFLYAAAGEEGRSEIALDAAKRLTTAVPESRFKQYPMLEEFRPVHLFALLRFARWDDVLAEPAPATDLRYATAIWHYGRGLAFAATDRLIEAQEEYDVFRSQARAPELADLKMLSGATARELLGIAEGVLGAEIARIQGGSEDEIESLREAIRIQDSLPYTEPPPWYFPVRHALGAAFLRASQPRQAEAVFREDLRHNRNDGWSLYGLAASLRAQGKQGEADSVQQDFERAWARADVAPTLLYR